MWTMRSAPLIAWLGLAAVAEAAAPGARLTVHWADPERQFPYALAQVAAEARAVFAPLRIGIDWTRADAQGAGSDVTIVLLAADRSGRLSERTLACAQRDQDRPVAWVGGPRLKQVLGLPVDRPLREPEVILLGRALARVTAHEIVHIVAPELPHARTGLMSAALGREFLVRPQARVDAALAQVLRVAFDARRLLSP